MSKLILPPAEISGRSAAVLAANAAGDTARIHALNKAAYHLALGDVAIVPNFDGFLVTSATRPGTVHRVSTVNGCSCEAAARGRACWHAAAIEILEDAGQRYTMPDLAAERRARARAAMEAIVDDLYG